MAAAAGQRTERTAPHLPAQFCRSPKAHWAVQKAPVRIKCSHVHHVQYKSGESWRGPVACSCCQLVKAAQHMHPRTLAVARTCPFPSLVLLLSAAAPDGAGLAGLPLLLLLGPDVEPASDLELRGDMPFSDVDPDDDAEEGDAGCGPEPEPCCWCRLPSGPSAAAALLQSLHRNCLSLRWCPGLDNPCASSRHLTTGKLGAPEVDAPRCESCLACIACILN